MANTLAAGLAQLRAPDVRAFLPDGSTWARTPGARSGLFAQAVNLDGTPAAASLEGRPALLTGGDPLAFGLAQLGGGATSSEAAAGGAGPAGAALAGAPVGVLGAVGRSVAFAVLGLVLVAAGAFAITRGD